MLPKNVLRALTVAVAAFVALLLGSSQALAYPSCVFDASADKKVVNSGSTVTFDTQANVDCNWTVKWNGVTRTGSGKTFTASFTAPQVDERTVIDALISCTYDDASCTPTGVGNGARVATWNKTIPVVVLPRGGSQGGDNAAASGDLPNTGGPSWWLLIGALLLLLAGAGAVKASRRDDETELDAVTDAGAPAN